MSIRWRARLMAMALFIAGVAAGAMAMRVHDLRIARDVLRSPAEQRRATIITFVLKRRLKLDDEQLVALEAAIQSQSAMVVKHEQSVVPGRQALRKDLLERCRGFLSPAQIEGLKTIIDNVNQRENRP